MATPDVGTVAPEVLAERQQEETSQTELEKQQEKFVAHTEGVRVLQGAEAAVVLRHEVRSLQDERLPILEGYAQSYLASQNKEDGERLERVSAEQDEALKAMQLRLIDELGSHAQDEQIEIRMINEDIEFRFDKDPDLKTVLKVSKLVVRSLGELTGSVAGALGLQESGLAYSPQTAKFEEGLPQNLVDEGRSISHALFNEDSGAVQSRFAEFTTNVHGAPARF